MSVGYICVQGLKCALIVSANCAFTCHDLAQVAAKDDELAAKDEQLSTSLREAAEVNEQYISELSSGQQQLESEVASLTARLEQAVQATAHKAQQDADMQTVQKRLRGQVGVRLN